MFGGVLMSELFKQVSYHEIYCDHCAKKTTADLVGFDFTQVFGHLIKANQDSPWSALMRLNLKFYYSLRDLCQEFDYQFTPLQESTLTLRVGHVKRQLEFLMQVPFAQLIEETEDSTLYNELYRQIDVSHNDADETMEDIVGILTLLKEATNDQEVILKVNMRIYSDMDDQGYPLVTKIQYVIQDKTYELTERICPHCGHPYHQKAGYHKEFVIGLAGLPRVGKTAYIASLVHQLKSRNNEHLVFLDDATFLDEGFKKFNDDILIPYQNGEIIKKTEVEHVGDIPLVYITVTIKNMNYNFMFVDMPGEIYDNHEENGVNYVLNKRSILTKADMVWCCINPEQINFNYKNQKENEMTQNSDIGQLSNLTSTLDMIFFHRQKAAVIITQSDLLDGKYALFRPNEDVQEAYSLPEGYFNLSEAMRISSETKRFVQEMKSFEITMDELFKGYNLFSVASYGFDVQKDSGKRTINPSLVELPFLWTLAVLGLIPTKKTVLKKSVFGQKEKQEVVNDVDDMFIR